MGNPDRPILKILVVDDEQLVCNAISMMLGFDRHLVTTASSAEEALVLLEKDKFDLVITDYAMPGMKGDELAVIIKSRQPKQSVAMITAYSETLESAGLPLPGIDYLISKPFSLDDLRRLVASAIPPS